MITRSASHIKVPLHYRLVISLLCLFLTVLKLIFFKVLYDNSDLDGEMLVSLDSVIDFRQCRITTGLHIKGLIFECLLWFIFPFFKVWF